MVSPALARMPPTLLLPWRVAPDRKPARGSLLSEADAIVKDRKELGQDAALELLKKVETSMRELISAENIMKANSSGLGAIAAEDGAEVRSTAARSFRATPAHRRTPRATPRPRAPAFAPRLADRRQ